MDDDVIPRTPSGARRQRRDPESPATAAPSPHGPCQLVAEARRPWPSTREWRPDGRVTRAARTSPDADASPDLVWVDIGAEGLEAFDPPRRVATAGSGLTPPPRPCRAPSEPMGVARWTPSSGRRPPLPGYDWARHAIRAALLCAVVSAAVDRLPAFRPETEAAVTEPTGPLQAWSGLPVVLPFLAAAHPVQPIDVAARPDGVAAPGPPAATTEPADGARATAAAPAGSGPRDLPAARTPGAARPPLASPAFPVPDARGTPASEAAPARLTARAVTGVPSRLAPAVSSTNTSAIVDSAPRPVAVEQGGAAPPAEAARPAAGPASPAAGASSQELEARAIERVLGRYRSAFNQLDAGAALTVWPTVNRRTLARAFEQLEGQVVSFDGCDIQIADRFAEAACHGSARYVPKVGSRTPRDGARRWTFRLRKTADRWLIDRVDAR